MGILLCEQNFRDVWRRNKSVRAEISKILRTHKHTHAAKLVVRIAQELLLGPRFGYMSPACIRSEMVTITGRFLSVDRNCWYFLAKFQPATILGHAGKYL